MSAVKDRPRSFWVRIKAALPNPGLLVGLIYLIFLWYSRSPTYEPVPPPAEIRLMDSDAEVRLAALKELRYRAPQPQQDPLFIQLLGDSDARIRMAAGRIVAARGEAAMPALVRALESSRFARVGDRNQYQQRLIDRLAQIGKPAVPVLVKSLKKEFLPIVRIAYAHDVMPLVCVPQVPNLALIAQSSIAKALAGIKPEGEQAVIDLLSDPNVGMRNRAILALGSFYPPDPDVQRRLGRFLRKGSDEERFAAANALSFLGESVVPDLIDALAAPLPETRKAAALALALMQPVPTNAYPALEQSLSDPLNTSAEHCQTCGAASYALERGGEPAVPFVLQALRGGDPVARRYAASTFFRAPKLAAAAASPLMELLTNAPEGRAEVLYALSHAANQNPEIIGRVRQFIGDADFRVAAAAAYALHSLDPKSPVELDSFFAKLHDPSAEVRKRSLEAIGNLSPAPDRVASSIIEMLNDSAPSVAIAAIDLLGKLKADSSVVGPALTNRLGSLAPGVANHAALALAKIDGPVRFLAPCLESGDSNVRWWAAMSLGEIPDRKTTVPLLARALTNDMSKVRERAAESLGRFHPGRPGNETVSQAAAALSAALDDPDQGVACKAASALRFQEAGRNAVPKLNSVMTNSTDQRRFYAAAALAWMKAVSDTVSKTLEDGLLQPDPAVRSACQSALDQQTQ